MAEGRERQRRQITLLAPLVDDFEWSEFLLSLLVLVASTANLGRIRDKLGRHAYPFVPLLGIAADHLATVGAGGNGALPEVGQPRSTLLSLVSQTR